MGLALDNRIGTRLRAARSRRDWSREALAFHSGVSWSAIAQIEAGRRTNLRPSTLAALARALGVTIDYLVTGSAASPPMGEHRALIYDSDEGFLAAAGPFLTDAIASSDPALVVTTEHNGQLVRDHLGPRAKEVEFADRSHWYSSPAETLTSYREFVNAKIQKGATWVRILGEASWAERTDSEARLWMRYESLVNLVFGAAPVSFLCPYDQRVVEPEIVERARETHPQTLERGSLASSAEYTNPGASILEP
jgi:transcriptional regulator with XRE-family HTH domain